MITLYRAPKFTQAQKYWPSLETGAPSPISPNIVYTVLQDRITCSSAQPLPKLHPTLDLPMIEMMCRDFEPHKRNIYLPDCYSLTNCGMIYLDHLFVVAYLKPGQTYQILED